MAPKVGFCVGFNGKHYNSSNTIFINYQGGREVNESDWSVWVPEIDSQVRQGVLCLLFRFNVIEILLLKQLKSLWPIKGVIKWLHLLRLGSDLEVIYPVFNGAWKIMTSVKEYYKLKRWSKKECCKHCRHVKLKGTMAKWPVQKQTHRTTQKHVRS